ncbi:hypothetical protein EVAR_18877_1 [Eumeta japonica]|uniref:Uncharacterized protein n=1 Tax=Eumeta variegata TaxID=151549 RepID=A0A4C1V3C8_EUMVA|nr:hypothetical protein EVAR_18877_1 [Eumeta japonica]
MRERNTNRPPAVGARAGAGRWRAGRSAVAACRGGTSTPPQSIRASRPHYYRRTRYAEMFLQRLCSCIVLVKLHMDDARRGTEVAEDHIITYALSSLAPPRAAPRCPARTKSEGVRVMTFTTPIPDSLYKLLAIKSFAP